MHLAVTVLYLVAIANAAPFEPPSVDFKEVDKRHVPQHHGLNGTLPYPVCFNGTHLLNSTGHHEHPHINSTNFNGTHPNGNHHNLTASCLPHFFNSTSMNHTAPGHELGHQLATRAGPSHDKPDSHGPPMNGPPMNVTGHPPAHNGTGLNGTMPPHKFNTTGFNHTAPEQNPGHNHTVRAEPSHNHSAPHGPPTNGTDHLPPHNGTAFNGTMPPHDFNSTRMNHTAPEHHPNNHVTVRDVPSNGQVPQGTPPSGAPVNVTRVHGPHNGTEGPLNGTLPAHGPGPHKLNGTAPAHNNTGPGPH